MSYSIVYFHSRVKADIESWPDGILADYARIVELLMEFGPNLRMPHSRAIDGGLFELRPRGREGIGRVFYHRPTCRNSSCVYQENTGHARAGTEDIPENDEGGTEWMN
jgi:hypothetical protein